LEEVVVRVLELVLALAGAYALALWFALVVWTYRDITTRSTNAVTHIFSTLVVVLFWVPGALIYLLLRPRETLDEAFQRSMEEEYLLQDLDEFPVCPECRRPVHDDFLYCPHCRAELRATCASCHRLVDLRWSACPYCAATQFETPSPVPSIVTHDAERARSRQGGGTLQAIDGGRGARRGHTDAERVDEPHDLDDTGPIDPVPLDQNGAKPARRGRRARDQAAHDRG
jgi:RNA polymerase subunit RPABC4/transcription elongation factor Spt4